MGSLFCTHKRRNTKEMEEHVRGMRRFAILRSDHWGLLISLTHSYWFMLHRHTIRHRSISFAFSEFSWASVIYARMGEILRISCSRIQQWQLPTCWIFLLGCIFLSSLRLPRSTFLQALRPTSAIHFQITSAQIQRSLGLQWPPLLLLWKR